MTNKIKAIRFETGDPHMDEVIRLSQEDFFDFKRDIPITLDELETYTKNLLSEEEALLERARIQAAKGKVENVTRKNYYDKELLRIYHRRMGHITKEVAQEAAALASLKELKEDDEAKRRRRASTFSLREFDEERGYTDDYVEIEDDDELKHTTSTPATYDEAITKAFEESTLRTLARVEDLDKQWEALWTIKIKPGKKKPDYQTRFLRRWAWMRKNWNDDERCWRRPTDWHVHYNPGEALRLTDGVQLPKDLVTAAFKTSMQLWEGCKSMEEVGKPVEWSVKSELRSAPAISPSVWTYPGGLVCFMNRRGILDIYRHHVFDRDVWWVARLKLPEAFTKRIPEDYDISATQVGPDHIALFTYQRFFWNNKTEKRFGECWFVPKTELSTGNGAVTLPSVPLHYYKPFSCKGALFVIGYNHHTDPHYKILSLDWKNPEATWKETLMNSLPVFFSKDALIGDYPESLYREGTASITNAADESFIYITAPAVNGQAVLGINTETWDFKMDICSIPPVWGSALIHDPDNDRLLLAGGIGLNCPEPLIRGVNLSSGEWEIHRSDSPCALTAYAGSFPVSPGSFAVVGGFWRTGHKQMNLQPCALVSLIETTDPDDFRLEKIWQERGLEYFPDGVLPEEDPAEFLDAETAEDDLEFDV